VKKIVKKIDSGKDYTVKKYIEIMEKKYIVEKKRYSKIR